MIHSGYLGGKLSAFPIDDFNFKYDIVGDIGFNNVNSIYLRLLGILDIIDDLNFKCWSYSLWFNNGFTTNPLSH